MSFEIVITEKKEVRKIRGHEWAMGAAKDVNGKDCYGYTPEIEKVVEVKTEMYRQTVETLDLYRVIQAVNDRTIHQNLDEYFGSNHANNPTSDSHQESVIGPFVSGMPGCCPSSPRRDPDKP